MPTISPSLIPLKSIGNLFSSLSGGDSTLNIRWLSPTDPVFYEALNRPIADIAVRQLVIAKSVDAIQAQVGRQSVFPFIVQPIVGFNTTQFVEIPMGMIWDMQVSVPAKWRYLRLAEIQRVRGTNDISAQEYTGTYRFVFSGVTEIDSTEVYIFYADYQLDSNLYFQPVQIEIVDANVAGNNQYIPAAESQTVSGWITFKTLSQNDDFNQTFYQNLSPPLVLTTNTQGYYLDPAVYPLKDTPAGSTSVTDDFSLAIESHGTGFITESAWTSIPSIGSDFQAWIESTNYPFATTATLIDTSNISIPIGIFKEFNILIPAGDGPMANQNLVKDDGFYQVFIDTIEYINSTGTIRFHFSTNGASGYRRVSYMDLLAAYKTTDSKNTVIPIIPTDTSNSSTDEIGRGHVVLSDLWTGANSDISDFYTNVQLNGGLIFNRNNTRIGSFGISRSSRYGPNKGQSEALAGSTSTKTSPINPSATNRYVTEQDQGLGNTVDFSVLPDIPGHIAFDSVGYAGSLNHRVVKLVVDSTAIPNDPAFYATYILPRLTRLFGRAPQFGDGWYNGVRFMWHNGDSWQG
jgi:hypothetical protein